MNPIEPSAEMRVMAHELREVYLALVAEGFTADEAMQIVAQIVSEGMKQA